jgi:hypothetical protein
MVPSHYPAPIKKLTFDFVIITIIKSIHITLIESVRMGNAIAKSA